ncbi:TPA: hypothetical protein HA265_06295 [Candidatus Woesearchaeota archaeon]|nr:hypothetical protein [Candidatus Woesearchaeota archaeon]
MTQETIDGKVQVLMLSENVSRDGALNAALAEQGYNVQRVTELDLLLRLRKESPERPYVIVLESENSHFADKADEDIRLGQHYIIMAGYAQEAVEAEMVIARKKMRREELPGAKKLFTTYDEAVDWVSRGRLGVHYENYTEYLAGREQFKEDTGRFQKVEVDLRREVTIETTPLDVLEQVLSAEEYSVEKARRDTAKTEKGRYSRYPKTDVTGVLSMDDLGAVEIASKRAMPDYAKPGLDNPEDMMAPKGGPLIVDGKRYSPEPAAVEGDYAKRLSHAALRVEF